MKKVIAALFLICCMQVNAQQFPAGNTVLDKVDANMSAKTTIMQATMQIASPRATRSMTMKTWTEGNNKSFTEYLAPAREKGTKMLKLDKQLWIYSPSTDRTIQISGNMLRQSVMGSDLSYEDMMDDTPLKEQYKALVTAEDLLDGRKCWIVNMTAIVSDINYYSQKYWVDQERFVPLKMQLFAKSGKQLKEITLSDVQKVQNRWYPNKMVYKDMLKEGKGTVFIIDDIRFNSPIPANLFNKAALR